MIIETSSNEVHSTNSKIIEEKKSIYPPSSPEDGEITEDEEIKNDCLNADKVIFQIVFVYYKYYLIYI